MAQRFMLIIMLMFLASAFLSAQPEEPPQRAFGMYPERIEKYKKMRLIEVLELNEEEAVRFTAKYNEHHKNMRGILGARMKLVDELEELLRQKAPESEYKKYIDELFAVDQKMFNERQRFHADIRAMLTPPQTARFLAFDRNFNRELRRAMDDLRRERRRR